MGFAVFWIFYLRRTFCTVVDPALCVFRKKIFFRFVHFWLEFWSSRAIRSIFIVSAGLVEVDAVVDGFSGGVIGVDFDGVMVVVVVELMEVDFWSFIWFDPGWPLTTSEFSNVSCSDLVTNRWWPLEGETKSLVNLNLFVKIRKAN